MKKKYANILFILNLFLIVSISLGTITRADLKLSTADNVNDSANDVIVVNIIKKSWKSTNLHPELDIDTMIHSSQDFTITFHETIIKEVNYSYQFIIYETLMAEEQWSVMFMSGGDGYLICHLGFWTTTGWSHSSTDLISVGTISGKNIEISIPGEALTIQSSHNWVSFALYADYLANKTYMDACPNNRRDMMLKGFSGPSDVGISGYELPILIGITAMHSIIFIYIYKKQKKSGI